MRFQLIGLNHKSAPVEVRERLAIPESRLPEACKRLSQHPGIDEGMIISTCNRVELIANVQNGTADLRGFLKNISNSIPRNSTSISTNIENRMRFGTSSA